MKKKGLLSLLLAVLLLLSAGCSALPVPELPETESADSSSADVSAYASWLADRLGGEVSGNNVVHKDGTVILVKGDDAMGIDTTGLRNEGYVIRSMGNDTVIVAKTDNGLDRGVRKFAAVAEKSGSTNVNYTDGLKIGKILLGGADIKNFKILLPKAAEGARYNFAATTTLAMENAAKELSKYIETATGIKLPIEYVEGLHNMTDAQIIEKCGNGFVLLNDPTAGGGSSIKGATEAINGTYVNVGPGELGTESYRLTVKDGIVRLVGGNQRGCLYGVYDFLEQYIGWRFLGGGVEYVYDAEEIIVDDVNVEFTPTFGYRATTFPAADIDPDHRDDDHVWHPEMKQNCFNTAYFGHTERWGYGLGSTLYHAHTFSYQVEPGMKGSQPYGDQPCLTDPYTKEVIINSMLNLIAQRQGAPWKNKIGYDMVQIGCSMNDNTNFCKCSNCMSYINEKDENNKRIRNFTDLYLEFVNDAADAVNEAYPGMMVNTAIYFIARQTPLMTTPRDNVSIYYCIQGCNQHTICDGLCAGYDTTLGTNNVEERAQLEAWTEICDRIYAWHYSVTFFSDLGPCPNIYEIYEDVTYVASLGVFGYYAEGSSSETNNFENLKAYLFCKLMYNADITREEFMALIDEYITIVYGEEAAPYIREYLDMHQESGDVIDGCFINNYHYPFDMMDINYYCQNYEAMKLLFDNAARYAKDEEALEKINILRLHMEFMGLSATYDRDYVNGTEESRAEYEASYKWLVDSYKAANLPVDRVNTKAPDSYDLSKNPMYNFIEIFTILSKEGRA